MTFRAGAWGGGFRAGAAWRVTIACLFGGLAAARGADRPPFTPAPALKGSWEFPADPKLPNVLLLGDSISLGYTRAVRERLTGRANVYRAMRGRNAANCGDTRMGLKGIDGWLETQKWDVIHFNWGLWDLCYRNPKAKTQGNRDKVGGTLAVPIAEYEQNLEKLVSRLEATGAVLIWASTTVVPEDEAGRFVGDEVKYNLAAQRVMAKHHIVTDDLFTLTKQFAGKLSIRPADVHYTAEGYVRIADQVAGTIEAKLPKVAR